MIELRTVHIEIRGPADKFGGITVTATSNADGAAPTRTLDFPEMTLSTEVLLLGVQTFMQALLIAAEIAEAEEEVGAET